MPTKFTPGQTPAPATAADPANPSVPSQGSQEAGAQTQAQASPLTLEAVESTVTKVLEKFTRNQQSERDKQEARITTRINDLRKGMEIVGQTLTPEAEAKARTALSKAPIIDDLGQVSFPTQDRPVQSQAETPTPQAPAGERPTAPNPQTAAAWAVMDGEGVEIDDADPEAVSIDWTSPQTAYASTQQAIAAKRRRTANAALPLSGGQPNSRPAHYGLNASDTLDMAFRQLRGK